MRLRPQQDSNLRSRLRRGLLCTPLTSGNEFPKTMIGGLSGETACAPRGSLRPHGGTTATRFPTLLISVHAGLRPYVSSHDALLSNAGGRSWTGANETQTEPRPRGGGWRASGSPRGGRHWGWTKNLRPPMGSTFPRFRVLSNTVHHRSRLYVTCADRQPAVARERLRTEVNETQTETRRSAPADNAERWPGGAR
jgi:hypothetical protein